jgi:excinuclease ABC subunit A
VIRSADWVVELGPEAGDAGGNVVFEGTPEDLAGRDTWTGRYLAAAFKPQP